MSDQVSRYLAAGRCRCCGRSVPFWTPDEIVKSIREWVETHGKTPAYGEWEKAGPGRPTAQTLIGMFGSWGNAIRAAGYRHFKTGAQRYWTRERVIEAILDWRFAHGDWPTAGQWHRAAFDHPSFGTVYHVFGSWPAALIAAGKVPTTKRERDLIARQAA